MAKKQSKPAIPEPSPRLLVWSFVIGFLLLAGVLGYSLATGYSGYNASPASKIERQSSFTEAAQPSVG